MNEPLKNSVVNQPNNLHFMTVWSKSPCLTIIQAAYLLANKDPILYQKEDTPSDVLAVLSILQNSINANVLKADLIHKADRVSWNSNTENSEYFYRPHPDYRSGVDVRYYKNPDWERTTIKTIDLKSWANTNSFESELFNNPVNQVNISCEYLNENHPMYSKELSIAIETWEAVLSSSPPRPKKGSRKSLIEQWINSNYALDNNAVKRIAVLINPDKSGGVTKTD
jgi:hypothetical protein